MSKIFTTLLLTLWLSVGAAWAGDFEDGVAAYDKKTSQPRLENSKVQQHKEMLMRS
jgi:hypothetical protein